MGNFQRGGGGGNNRGGGFRSGGGNFRDGNRGGFRGDRNPTMHKAVCDECHKNCEVPFKPSNDKPIYCSECFGSKRGDNDRGPRRDFKDNRPKREFNDKPSFNKPTSTNDDLKKQLGEISSKLDRLLNAMEETITPKKEVKKVATPKITVKKVLKKVAKKNKK